MKVAQKRKKSRRAGKAERQEREGKSAEKEEKAPSGPGDPSERAPGFYGDWIEVEFEEGEGPLPEKRPGLPSAFVWRNRRFEIRSLVREWHDYGRLSPGFSADRHPPQFMRDGRKTGSWGVGRDYYRVVTDTNEVFDIYYDRRPRGKKRKGGWTLYRKIG